MRWGPWPGTELEGEGGRTGAGAEHGFPVLSQPPSLVLDIYHLWPPGVSKGLYSGKVIFAAILFSFKFQELLPEPLLSET